MASLQTMSDTDLYDALIETIKMQHNSIVSSGDDARAPRFYKPLEEIFNRIHSEGTDRHALLKPVVSALASLNQFSFTDGRTQRDACSALEQSLPELQECRPAPTPSGPNPWRGLTLKR